MNFRIRFGAQHAVMLSLMVVFLAGALALDIAIVFKLLARHRPPNAGIAIILLCGLYVAGALIVVLARECRKLFAVKVISIESGQTVRVTMKSGFAHEFAVPQDVGIVHTAHGSYALKLGRKWDVFVFSDADVDDSESFLRCVKSLAGERSCPPGSDLAN